MKREFLQSLTVGEASLPKEVIDAIMAENGKDIQAAKAAGADWEEKYHRAMEEHSKQLADLAFSQVFTEAFQKAKGRNDKAIAALLDMESLKSGEDPKAAVTAALAQLKEEHGYLFESELTPPPYATGTGVQSAYHPDQPATLAGALRERMEHPA